MSIISVENVHFAYGNDKKEALSGISLEIEQGDFVAIIGHNGSGKSTLARHLNGLLTPTSGKVTVFGMDTSDESLAIEIRKKVGIVFQNPDNQMVTTVVEDDIAFGPENIGIPPKEIRERVDAALRAVDMEKYAESAPHMLSGGQKQRVAIAGILALRPDVIVFDEATAMLDPQGRREIMDIAKKLNEENGIAIVMITQYMEEAIYAKRVCVLDNGVVAMDGTPKQVFSRSARIVGLGLDVPPVVALRNRLIESGMRPVNVLTTAELSSAVATQILSKGR